MKKIITLAMICALNSNNNISGMLRCIKHAIPKHTFIQQRHHINVVPQKNIFTINKDSEPKEEVHGHLQDLYYRNIAIARLLKEQEVLSGQIQEILKLQNDIAIQHTFHGGSIRINSLNSQEDILKNLLNKNTDLSLSMRAEDSVIRFEPRATAKGHANE